MRVGPITDIHQRSARDALVIWIILALAYLVFAGSVSVNEGLAGIGCASLGTAWWWAVGRRGGVRFRFDRVALRPLGPALLSMPRQTVRVGRNLVRAVLGRTRDGLTRERSAAAIPWAVPDSPAARAVGLFAASLAPDSYVLTLDREHGTVMTHVQEDDAR
jgi:hypothetical protein